MNKSQLARDLNVSRSSLYYKPKLPDKDCYLKDKIFLVLDSNPAYGYRRIALAHRLNKKRVHRVMQKYEIKSFKRKARWRKRRDERIPASKYLNLIRENIPSKPNQIYTGDFTYIKYLYNNTHL